MEFRVLEPACVAVDRRDLAGRPPVLGRPARRARPAHALQGHGRHRARRGRGELPGAPRRDARRGGRIGLRQERHRAHHHAPHRDPARRDRGRRDLVRRARRAAPLERRDARRARGRDGHDLPGAHDVAQPGADGGRPDRRGRGGPPQGEPRGGPRAGHRDAPPGGHPRGAAPRAPVPPRAVGRHAPARHDRPGPLLRSQAPHRRRAHHGARRDDPGPDPGTHPPRAAGDRHGPSPHHPRSRRGGRDRAAPGRHVRRQGRRDGHGRGGAARPAASLHRGPPRLHSRRRPCAAAA